MTLHPKNHWQIPEQTAQIARASFPKGNEFMKMYDELGTLYTDSDFTTLFPARSGQSAISPAKLALITVMQFALGLTDRQAADAVRARIDWKYALGLDLTDSGFDSTVLGEFRHRLCEHELSNQLLDLMLLRFTEKKLIKHRGKQRTDSTQVLAAIRQVNRLELVGEALRAALNEIAFEAPQWLKRIVSEDWFDNYSWRFDNYRLPKEKSEREQLGLKIGFDGHYLLQKIWFSEMTQCDLRQLKSVEILRKIWIQQYTLIAPRKLKLRPREEYDALQQRRREQVSREFQQKYQRRAGIEGTISQAVCKFNLRQARYCGLGKTHLQHVATACAINLSRFFTWSKQVNKAQTRTSLFARLRVC